MDAVYLFMEAANYEYLGSRHDDVYGIFLELRLTGRSPSPLR